MNVTQALRGRKSVRAFQAKPVPKDVLLDIFEAANWSPSWADTQPWEVYGAGGEVLERIRERFLERYEAGVPPANDIPRPTDWPAVMLAALEHAVGSVVAVNLAAYPDILHEELGIP